MAYPLSPAFRWLTCACLLALVFASIAPGQAAFVSDLRSEPSETRPAPVDAPHSGEPGGFELLGFFPGTYHDIALAPGGLAYLGDTLGLRVLDVGFPTQPVEIAFLPTSGAIIDVELAGSLAYLADFNNGLHIVDVADPAHPQVLGSLATPAPADDVAIQGDYAYVACWSGGLRVVNISDPVHPQEVDSYSQPGISGLAKGVAVDGNYAYVLNSDVDAHNSGVWVFDVTDPTQIALVGNLEIAGADFQDLVIAGDILYAAEASTGLRVLDISDPLAINLVGTYLVGNSHAVTIEDDWLYLTVEDPGGAGLGGVAAFNATDPQALEESGFYPLPANSAGVAAQGDTVFVPRDLGGGLFILWHKNVFAAFGQVLLPNQTALAGATIQVSPTLTTTSGADGIFRFDNLPTGGYTFTPQFPAGCAANPCAFTPPNRAASLPPAQGGLNFTLLPAPLSDTLFKNSALSLVYTDTLGLATMFDFPLGTVDSTSVVMITPTLATPGSGYAFTGHAFNVSVYAFNGWDIDLDFNMPVTATVSYAPDDVRLVADASQLQLRWWDGGAWQDVASTCDPPSLATHDLANRRYAVPVCKSGLYALFGPSWGVYLPLVRR